MPPSESPANLAIRRAEDDVVRSRQHLVGTVLSLRTEIERSLRWRTWYGRAPTAFLGMAFLAGLVGALAMPHTHASIGGGRHED